MSKSFKDEAKAVGSRVREGQELEKREDRLTQEVVQVGPEVAKMIHEAIDKKLDEKWNKIYEENKKTGMKTFSTPQAPIWLTEELAQEKIEKTQGIRLEAGEEMDKYDWGKIYKEAGLKLDSIAAEKAGINPQARTSGIDLEKINKYPSAKWRDVYAKARVDHEPIPAGNLEKFKEKITDLAERIDGYIYDKAHSTGKSVKDTFNSFKEKVNKALNKQTQPEIHARKNKSQSSSPSK